ncbi:MAG: DUF4435 domain-containing protein [Muribaculaceae bacterium]|nr:DUF4435 domain-containing protein [Muribaculaceae bacterium]
MNILLPPKKDKSREEITTGNRQVTIIGANGAGKTRFTEWLINDLQEKAFRMSIISALYDSREYDTLPGSIDMLYKESVERTNILRNDSTSQAERLMSLLFQEEMLNLIAYKVSLAENPDTKLPPTKLDKVTEVWQDIFPGSKILIEGGKMLISRENDKDCYSSVKLSAGERAVMYYVGATLMAPENAIIFVDNPGIFLHQSITKSLWDRIEELRPDCTFIYTTHDIDFASSRTNNAVVWVREYDAAEGTWDYDILPEHAELSDDIYLTIIGARKPVLFIEGDGVHSIDSKLYPLIFSQYTVKPLGSCNKVIEATRAFNDLKTFHQMDSYGIVDRDRRDDGEVKYLRTKKVLVPNVAEIENIMMLEEVIRTVASRYKKDETKVFTKVKAAILDLFKQEVRQQALMHTRHRVKRTLEYRIDGRFTNINSLEDHINDLVKEINPRGMYDAFCREFHGYVSSGDYQNVLRVFNRKSMIPSSNVSNLCGLTNKEAYIRAIINILKENGKDAQRIRRAVIKCFGLDSDNLNSLKNEAQTTSKNDTKK